MVVFFIMFHKILPDEYKISLDQIAKDIETTKKNNTLFNANEIYNQALYKQAFSTVIDEYKIIKNISTNFSDKFVRQ